MLTAGLHPQRVVIFRTVREIRVIDGILHLIA
jgi:hypothetical protein